MMDAAQADAASALLLAHCRDRTVLPVLPGALRPANRGEGYAIQARLERHGPPLWGWKIAATSAAGQHHIGVDGPMAGRLLAAMVHPDGAELSLAGNRMRVAEIEFAFRMGRDFRPAPMPTMTRRRSWTPLRRCTSRSRYRTPATPTLSRSAPRS